MLDDNDYTPADDGPEAELLRRDAQREYREQKFREEQVDRLIASLRPGDAYWRLPAWWQVERFGLSRFTKPWP